MLPKYICIDRRNLMPLRGEDLHFTRRKINLPGLEGFFWDLVNWRHSWYLLILSIHVLLIPRTPAVSCSTSDAGPCANTELFPSYCLNVTVAFPICFEDLFTSKVSTSISISQMGKLSSKGEMTQKVKWQLSLRRPIEGGNVDVLVLVLLTLYCSSASTFFWWSISLVSA